MIYTHYLECSLEAPALVIGSHTISHEEAQLVPNRASFGFITFYQSLFVSRGGLVVPVLWLLGLARK